MYFPHLIARKEELLALRNLSELVGLKKTILPILEPVSEKLDELRRCVTALDKAGVGSILITNPNQGTFKVETSKPWKTGMATLISDLPKAVPAYRCIPGTKATDVDAFLKRYKNKQAALIYAGAKFSDAEIVYLTGLPQIEFHIVLRGKLSQPQRALIPKKKAVEIVDRFTTEERNADYSGSELFCDHHKTYKALCVGFGDYSVTGPKLKTGGGPAHAVAIHIMYHPPASDEIFVEHFVSDDTDPEVGSVGGKYLQAAQKIVVEAAARPEEFLQTDALQAFISDAQTGYFPGLGMSKRRQIMHHLQTMHTWLLN